jgi:hypothetical protein
MYSDVNFHYLRNFVINMIIKFLVKNVVIVTFRLLLLLTDMYAGHIEEYQGKQCCLL